MHAFCPRKWRRVLSLPWQRRRGCVDYKKKVLRLRATTSPTQIEVDVPTDPATTTEARHKGQDKKEELLNVHDREEVLFESLSKKIGLFWLHRQIGRVQDIFAQPQERAVMEVVVECNGSWTLFVEWWLVTGAGLLQVEITDQWVLSCLHEAQGKLAEQIDTTDQKNKKSVSEGVFEQSIIFQIDSLAWKKQPGGSRQITVCVAEFCWPSWLREQTHRVVQRVLQSVLREEPLLFLVYVGFGRVARHRCYLRSKGQGLQLPPRIRKKANQSRQTETAEQSRQWSGVIGFVAEFHSQGHLQCWWQHLIWPAWTRRPRQDHQHQLELPGKDSHSAIQAKPRLQLQKQPQSIPKGLVHFEPINAAPDVEDVLAPCHDAISKWAHGIIKAVFQVGEAGVSRKIRPRCLEGIAKQR